VAGTLVRTWYGLKPIEQVRLGDLVIARNDITGETAWKPVVRVIRNGEKDVLRVYYVDSKGKRESLGVTVEHPFMLEGKHWVEAGKLRIGDKLMRFGDGLLTVTKISKYSVGHHTYNLEIADFHTYFVGTMGVWVHNPKPCPLPRNGHLAGDVHPKTGVPFDKDGFPDFSAVAKEKVQIEQTGSRAGDVRAANKAAGLKETPEDYVWHHHQDGKTMQLVPEDVHAQTGHTGGFNPNP
jgi:hypothetical protein